jgi:hypothetical protein
MNAVSGACRRWAAKLAQHASFVLPGAQSSWAEAMRRELDYIEDDRTALHWAVGCVLASYKARFAARPGFGTRAAWRHAATYGVLMVFIGFALLENAGGQTEPPRPVPDGSTCDPQKISPDVGPTLPSGAVSAPRSVDQPAQTPDAPCADRTAPIRFLPKRQTP